jgi:phage FluMu gp28-like protein
MRPRKPKDDVAQTGIRPPGRRSAARQDAAAPLSHPTRRAPDAEIPNRKSRVPGAKISHPQSEIANPKSPIQNLPPALHLLPYQRRWIEDNSPLKIAVKARQIGYSFAATLRAVFECLKRKATWIFLSKGERQSRLLMEKVQEHIQSCGIVARAVESSFFEGTLIKQLETRFLNGSVIYGLPANPDTARGYSGNVTLDEFAFHADADKIFAALFPTITRGYSLEVISTPNGTQGKFYELAKAAGLVGPTLASARPGQAPALQSAWSAHSCDIYEAVRQGLKIDLELLRAGCDDESAWQQEYCCGFISLAENFIPPELLASSLSAEASADFPPELLASASRPFSRQWAEGSRQPAEAESSSPAPPQPPQANSEFFLGIDIGRHHDRTVFWLDEVQAPAAGCRVSGSDPRHLTPDTWERVSIARLVRSFANTPFDEQLAFARQLLSLRAADGPPLVRRAAIDSTGMGAPLAESLAREFGPRVEPVVFTAAVKEDLAYRTRRRLENRLSLLPDSRDIRRAFASIKRLVTLTGNLRFDAERTDAGHADEFWAKALADYAAEAQPVSRLADGFLADGTPLIAPSAFELTDTAWVELETM